eukprot:jgi/Mesvir1/1610/Mv14573-RA.1
MAPPEADAGGGEAMDVDTKPAGQKEEVELDAEEIHYLQDTEDEQEDEGKAPSAPSTPAASEPPEEPLDDDEEPTGISPSKKVIAKQELQRLRQMKLDRKQQMEEILAKQNEIVEGEADKTKGRLKYLLQQTEVFAHFVTGGHQQAAGKVKGRGKGRQYSKVTEDEEDAEILKENADEGPTVQNTRLTCQPQCIKGGKMRDYQIAGLNWLIRLYENGINGILADEMGLGKTLQTISFLGFLSEFKGIDGPHMIITPKSTLANWNNEFKKWCPHLRAFRFIGNQDERQQLKETMLIAGKFDVVITSYEMVIKERSALQKFAWRYIVIDEAHRIKNENSILSRQVRQLHSNFRLLLTGTPLQNNLHELWALLNFLLPDIFSSSEDFDTWFAQAGSSDNNQAEAVALLHKVLRPFLLRRLKSEVEKGLPPKKETILKVGMTEMQKMYYRALLQKDIDIVNSGGERSRLLNIAMQLRKCCNHPYLFQGAEPGPPYFTGEHLVDNAGKLVILDRLLPKLKQRDSRVLIFSQMTRVLDILEDYLLFRGYSYCRIDGNTSGEDREASIDAFNAEGSDKFIFLLSTRAGGLGINLATADVVVLYDSDWNPQVDLQAMDRAHRIGQKKEVQVFRFATEHTIEEKVIERAYKKLALDALVIQQGRLAEASKTVNKDDLLQMVRYGADVIFSSKDSTVTDEDIDAIIAKGQAATAELEGKMKKFTEDAQRFKLDGADITSLYSFEGTDYASGAKDGADLKRLIADNWIEPPKRERKKNYNEQEMYRSAHRLPGGAGGGKSKEPRLPRMPNLQDFQFFEQERLRELFEIEAAHLIYMAQRQDKEEAAGEDESAAPPPLTEKEQAEKEQLLDAGFSSWSRREFNMFCRAAEKYGRWDLENISAEMEGKTYDEVKEYSEVFWKRYKELNDYERIIKAIERGEHRIRRRDEIMHSIGKKMDRYRNPWRELRISYGQNKGKAFTEENDRFLVCMTYQLGYGAWEELKVEVRKSWMFRFDWFIKSRTAQELARRTDTLIRLIEKENAEIDEKEKAARREQAAASKQQKKSSGSTPQKKSGGKLSGGTGGKSGSSGGEIAGPPKRGRPPALDSYTLKKKTKR